MKRILPFLLPILLLTACGSEGSECVEAGKWSAANSGGLCQVNIFGDVDYAAYCTKKADNSYDCACGAVAENPLEFSSDDFCDLDGEARVCEAIARCGWPL